MVMVIYRLQTLLLGLALLLAGLPTFCEGERLPFHVPTDGAKWFGNDGKWSTITARLGNPVQPVFLLAGTGSSITTAVSSILCNNPESAYSCIDRGREFNTSLSTTWKEIGLYDFMERPQLNDGYLNYTTADLGWGDFGLDSIKMEDGVGRVVTVDKQVIAVVNDTTQLLGTLGLGIKKRSLISDEGYQSFVTSLYKNGLIPSRSWGYTAGNYYESQRPLDLVIGGTNLGRYSPNSVSFPLDVNQEPSVNLHGLTVTASGIASWGPGPEALLLKSEMVQIDSTTPFIWLPEPICRQFEKTLGLKWNKTTNLYLLDTESSVYKDLVQLNLTFSFDLSPTIEATESVKIQVPYTSLDMEISFPYLNTTEKVKYFPLKRAPDQSQYTLGRAFLQNAYLAVDYERSNFSIHQALYPPKNDEVVAILRPEDVPETGKSKGLSLGAKIGIAAGGAAALVCLAGVLICLRRRRNKKKLRQQTEPPKEPEIPDYDPSRPPIWEAYGDSVTNKGGYPGTPTTTTEMAADDIRVQRTELPAFNPEPAELQAIPAKDKPGLPASGYQLPSSSEKTQLELPNNQTQLQQGPQSMLSPQSGPQPAQSPVLSSVQQQQQPQQPDKQRQPSSDATSPISDFESPSNTLRSPVSLDSRRQSMK